ncbi:hypothetical protein AAMO2058_000249700 [Amorphochlora amoebiformis]|uniref:Endonuclease/exonuclease/phosphatase domain-containing protein n=1 Tax=Amorphochlora amoebiformis TaxID=1561963 RepID=A0A7S0D1R6_9EUKA|mmetsp:Transcript_17450/g.27786  ORF Transcript_17450/g.27786 Transcript_17450/m.27786 type:complete len:619 (+) Transcript_17450:59-1915(+)
MGNLACASEANEVKHSVDIVNEKGLSEQPTTEGEGDAQSKESEPVKIVVSSLDIKTEEEDITVSETKACPKKPLLRSRPSWRDKVKNGRKVPPTLDLHLSRLPQPIVGCEITPIVANGDPCQRPEVVRWLRRKADSKGGWMEIAKGWQYTPSNDDLGYQLRNEFRVENKIYAEESNRVLPAPNEPNHRTWIRRAIKRESSGNKKPANSDSSKGYSFETFRVLSWNTLSDSASHSWEKMCDHHMLLWPYRIRNIMRHIKMQNADILCLQEVDKKHMSTFWQRDLCEEDTYQSQYAGSNYGCAIFYRRQKFQMLKCDIVDFKGSIHQFLERPCEQWIKDHPHDEASMIECRDEKLNVRRKGLIFELQPNGCSVGSSRRDHLFVATLHLYKSEKRSEPYIRIFQIHSLLKALEKFTAGVEDPKIIVAGDFNSVPGSSVYHYMSHGFIDPSHIELKDCVLFKAISPHELTHNFKFKSSYKEVLKREESYCRHSPQLTPVVEYIWFTHRTDFHAKGVVPIPEKEKKIYPQIVGISSDHQMLIAEFTTNRLVEASNDDRKVEVAEKRDATDTITPRHAAVAKNKLHGAGGFQSRISRLVNKQSSLNRGLQSPRSIARSKATSWK